MSEKRDLNPPRCPFCGGWRVNELPQDCFRFFECECGYVFVRAIPYDEALGVDVSQLFPPVAE